MARTERATRPVRTETVNIAGFNVSVTPEEKRRMQNPSLEKITGASQSTDDNGESFDYEKDLEINPNFLDAEFLNHSQVFMKYAKESARANKTAKLAHEKVKTLRSQLIKVANEDPDNCLGKGIKPIAVNVEAYFRDHATYKRLKQEWIEATYDADLLTNAVFAFQARKVALENLVRLHGQQYFSTPNEPRDLPEAAERLKELKDSSTEKRIRERTNRSR